MKAFTFTLFGFILAVNQVALAYRSSYDSGLYARDAYADGDDFDLLVARDAYDEGYRHGLMARHEQDGLSARHEHLNRRATVKFTCKVCKKSITMTGTGDLGPRLPETCSCGAYEPWGTGSSSRSPSPGPGTGGSGTQAGGKKSTKS